MRQTTLLRKLEELSARVSAVEAENTRLKKTDQPLQEQNARLKKESAQLQQNVAGLQMENQLLRQKLDYYIRYHFGGQRNEGVDKHQLDLLLQGLPGLVVLPAPESKVQAIARASGGSHPVRQVLNEAKLETRELILEPEEVKAQPEGWRKISEERTTLLDWEPGKFFKQVTVRPRYVKEERFALAELPPQVIEQGMVGPGLLAEIIVKKFEHHLPLYRQERIFKEQYGVELSRKTMGDWVEQAAELVGAVYRAIKEDLQQGSYLQADETPIRCLDPDVKGKSVLGYLWAYSRPGGDALFEWRMSRSREGPREFLKNFRGTLQTDAYRVYESLAGERKPELVLAGCWAHGRRGFKEAIAENKVSAWFVKQIGLLYAIEKRLREQDAGPKLRRAVRQWQSEPVLKRLRKAMELVRQRTLPEGLLGQAIGYVLSRWETFTRFVEEGRLEIDNNLIENAIRPSALGKKNWLFIGHPEAGQRSAILYTLLASCRRRNINPFDYLKDLFTRLPATKISEIKEFTPAGWAKNLAKQKNRSLKAA